MNERHEIERQQRDYYNGIAGRYDRHYSDPQVLGYRRWVYDRFFQGRNLSGLRVLDAMCGGGQNTAYFKSRVASVEGIDISEEQCRLYAGHHPECAVQCGSILQTPYADASFDLIVVESLHHLHPYVNDGIRELARLLRPGGSLFFWEPAADSLVDRARRYWYRRDPAFFESNEASISLARVLHQHADAFAMLSHAYGGNIAYVLVSGSMFFRIPAHWVPYYAPVLMALERVLETVQPRSLSCWVAAELRRRPAVGTGLP